MAKQVNQPNPPQKLPTVPVPGKRGYVPPPPPKPIPTTPGKSTEKKQ